MGRKKAVWIGFAVLCLFSFELTGLAHRNEANELLALEALHPDDWKSYTDDHGNSHWQIRFVHLSASRVLTGVGIGRARLHLSRSGAFATYWMPSGRMFSVSEYPGSWTDVQVYQPKEQSWLERAWLSLRFRCGMPKEEE